MPFAVGAGLIAAIAKGLERRFKTGPTTTWPLLAFPLLGIALFWGMGQLIQAGVVGWTIGYVAAKLGAELLVLGIPLLAVQAGREERAALAPEKPAPSVPGRRRKLP